MQDRKSAHTNGGSAKTNVGSSHLLVDLLQHRDRTKVQLSCGLGQQ